ncbi:MAG: hypothetical protein F4X92_08840 [Gammaproteobacteria bacterium]|nr:hypothetical protein [Gammaproteobacteria bacterium]
MNDLVAFGKFAGLKERKAKSVIAEITEVMDLWTEFAEQAKVHDEYAVKIQHMLRANRCD